MGVSKQLLTVEAGQDNMAAAAALAERLESEGYAAHAMRMIHSMMGIATIHIHHADERDEVILVETGDLAALRESVGRLQQMPASSPVTWSLATPLDIPADVDAVMGDSALAKRNHQWTIDGLVPLSAPLTDVSALAESVSQALEAAEHGSYSVDGGADTLGAIDALVSRLRPADNDTALPGDGTMPLAALVGLGVLATEVASRAFGGGTLGRLTDNFTSFEPCNTLAEAQGFPVLALDSGHALQFASKVQRRYGEGASESLVELFERAAGGGASSHRAPSVDHDTLDTAMGIGGALLNNLLAELSEEGELGMPKTFSLIDGSISIGMVMADNSVRAHEMMKQTFAKDRALAAAGGCDTMLRDLATGTSTDGIALYIAVDGVELAQLAVPYTVTDGTPSFPNGVWATQ